MRFSNAETITAHDMRGVVTERSQERIRTTSANFSVMASVQGFPAHTEDLTLADKQ